MTSESSRPDYEQAQRTIIVPPGSMPEAEKEIIAANDKPAPTGPPDRKERKIAPWFKEIFDAMQGMVNDEGFVLDLCLEKAIEIVQFNHDRGVYGIDHFQEGAGSATRTNLVALAVPMAVELYKQVLDGMNRQRETFEAMYDRAKAKLAEMTAEPAKP